MGLVDTHGVTGIHEGGRIQLLDHGRAGKSVAWNQRTTVVHWCLDCGISGEIDLASVRGLGGGGGHWGSRVGGRRPVESSPSGEAIIHDFYGVFGVVIAVVSFMRFEKHGAVNNVVYQKNGVTIRTIPAIHIFDGCVSFILEWNGLKFCYSSDTFPNKWWREYTKNADISIHECFVAPESLVEKQGFTPEAALNVGTQIHTSPAQFGKVMAETKPRLAVAYHFFNDFDTAPAVLRDVRRTYAGKLALAVDYMVFNVTKEDIKVRMAAVEESIWPQPSTIPLVPPDPKLQRTALSKKMREGRVVHRDVLQEVYDDINKRFGSNENVPE